jgi:hypothetical protein
LGRTIRAKRKQKAASLVLALLIIAVPLQAKVEKAALYECTVDLGIDCPAQQNGIQAMVGLDPGAPGLPEGGKTTGTVERAIHAIPEPDRNRSLYHKNKVELSLEAGWLPINIPFPFDFLLGGGYNKTPLNYTITPVFSVVRWHLNDIGGRSFWRGNWNAEFGGTVSAIPRGPESRFFGYIMGIRRNFIQPNWKVVPYFDGRVGIGNIDAKGPLGVTWAQGQDLTFTLILSSGMRYHISQRYAISAGVTYLHISNMYLSEPKYLNYGINVYGPMIGIDITLGGGHRHVARK